MNTTLSATDRSIELLARSQHGVFSLAQARRLGITRSMVENRRTTGRWIQLAPSVYALPSNPLTWHRQVMAAMLATPRSSVSGLAAAHLHALDGCRPVRPELTVPRGSGHRSRLALVHQSDRFAATTLGPFRIGTIEQTLCDAAGRLGSRLDEVVESAVTSGAVSVGSVLARAQTLHPRPPKGLDALVRSVHALAVLPATPTSVLEVALYRVLADPRIPMWDAQSTPSWWPRVRERLDAHIPSWRLIVEADGRAWHTRRADFERDRRRDHIALAHGHRTVRFTHGQLVHEPDYVLQTLLAIGSAGGPGANGARSAG